MLRLRVLLLTFITCSIAFGQSKREIDSLNNLDHVNIVNDLAAKKILFTNTVAAAKKMNYSLGTAASLVKLALVESYLNDYDESVNHYIESVKIYEKLGDQKTLALVYSELGFVLRKIDNQLALSYFRKSLDISKQVDIGSGLSKIYDNYGQLLQGDKLDSAIYYYNRALNIKRKYNDHIGIPYSLNKLATAYSTKKEYTKAFKMLDASDFYRRKEKGLQGIADNLAYRGDIFFDMKQKDSATYYYEKSLKLAKQVKFQALVRFCYDRLTTLYSEKKDFKSAFKYQRLLKNHDDSLLNVETRNKMANLQVEFETEKKQKEIVQQKLINAKQARENLDNQLQLELRRRWIMGIGAVVVLLLIGIYFVYNTQRVKRKNEREALLLEGQLEQAQMGQQFAEEKLKISRELHDNIGSHLTFMISSVDNLVYQESQEEKIEKLKSISNFGRTTMKDLRTTIWAMKNDGGTLEELTMKLHELRNALQDQLRIELETTADLQLQLNAMQLLNTYRIIQESLQNTLKYANATVMKIQLKESNGEFSLECSDNGCGFDISSNSYGNGLINMETRAHELGGTSKVVSEIGKGTSVMLTFPL